MALPTYVGAQFQNLMVQDDGPGDLRYWLDIPVVSATVDDFWFAQAFGSAGVAQRWVGGGFDPTGYTEPGLPHHFAWQNSQGWHHINNISEAISYGPGLYAAADAAPPTKHRFVRGDPAIHTDTKLIGCLTQFRGFSPDITGTTVVGSRTYDTYAGQGLESLASEQGPTTGDITIATSQAATPWVAMTNGGIVWNAFHVGWSTTDTLPGIVGPTATTLAGSTGIGAGSTAFRHEMVVSYEIVLAGQTPQNDSVTFTRTDQTNLRGFMYGLAIESAVPLLAPVVPGFVPVELPLRWKAHVLPYQLRRGQAHGR